MVNKPAIINDNHAISGTNKINIIKLTTKNAADPAKDLLKILTDTVILPTIAANESATVKISTAGTAISFLNSIKVIVADINK